MEYYLGEWHPVIKEWPKQEKRDWFKELVKSKPGPSKGHLFHILRDPDLRGPVFAELMKLDNLEDKDFELIIQPMPPGDFVAELAWVEYKRRKKGKFNPYELKEFVNKQFGRYFEYYKKWAEGSDDKYAIAVIEGTFPLFWDAFEMFLELEPTEDYNYKETLLKYVATPILQEKAWDRLLQIGPTKQDLLELMKAGQFYYSIGYRGMDLMPVSHPENLWEEYLKLEPTEEDLMKVFDKGHQYRELAWEKMKPVISNSALISIVNGYQKDYIDIAWEILKPVLRKKDAISILDGESGKERKNEAWEMFKEMDLQKEDLRKLIHKDQDFKIQAAELLLKKSPTNDDLFSILNICYGKVRIESARRLLNRTKNKKFLSKIAEHYDSDLGDLKIKAAKKLDEEYPVQYTVLYYLENDPEARKEMWPKFLNELKDNKPLLEMIKCHHGLADMAWEELLKRNPSYSDFQNIIEYGHIKKFVKEARVEREKTTHALMETFWDKYDIPVGER